jgi:pimeloyl-ACP methyl ester carboxylesterase
MTSESTTESELEYMQQVNDASEAGIWAVTQKPFNQSLLIEKSGPPGWKQLPTWYQNSEDDHMIPPDVQRTFAQQINATTISLKVSHASNISHPDEIANFILNAAKGK